MYQPCSYIAICYCILIGSLVDFDSNPMNITFAAGEVSKSVYVPVMCDKIVEEFERFDIILALTSNNPQVRIGRDRSVGVIRDSTGNDRTVVSILNRWYDVIKTVVVNFNQSSYEVMEGRNIVVIIIELNRPSSTLFQVIINSMDITTYGK